MNVKVVVFAPTHEIQAVDPDLAASFQKLSDQIRQKAKHDNDLKKRKDDLLLEKLKKAGKAQLYDQISQAGREFDSMSQDLQNKIANITGDLDGLLKTIDNQRAQLAAQEKALSQNMRVTNLDKQRQDLLDHIAALKKARDDAIASGAAGSVVEKVL